MPIRLRAGTPLVYSVFSNGCYDYGETVYDIYMTVEQLN